MSLYFEIHFDTQGNFDEIQAIEGLLDKQYGISFDTGASVGQREWFIDYSLVHPYLLTREQAVAKILEILDRHTEIAFDKMECVTEWGSLITDRDKKIAELESQVVSLQSQLGIAFEIMFDSQIAECQHLFENKIDIVDSSTTNQTEGEN